MRLLWSLPVVMVSSLSLLIAVVTRVPVRAQGYVLNGVHTPLGQELRTYRGCDYASNADQTDPQTGARTVQHADGTVVVKAPGQWPNVRLPQRGSAGAQMTSRIASDPQFEANLVYQLKDTSDGSSLILHVYDILSDDVYRLTGELRDANNNPIAVVTCMTANRLGDPANRFFGDVLLWYMYPNSQDYGSGALFFAQDGQTASGYWSYGGKSAAWNVQVLE